MVRQSTRPARRISLFVMAMVALVWLALARSVPVQAATPYVVTNCTSQGLADGMNFMNINHIADGIISFNCDNVNAAATISITQGGGYNVTTGSAYTIDGGNVITLTGLDNYRLLNVQAGAALTLTHIVLTHGNSSSSGGGAVYSAGTLTVSASRVISNQTTAAHNGGALVAFGALTIMNSEFANNQAGNGGALWLFNGGTPTTISGSSFHDNQATDPATGYGGAILVANTAAPAISGSSFNLNHAQYGGAVYVTANAALTVTSSSLSGNSAANDGGGIENHGTDTLDDVALIGNSAQGGDGGGISNDQGALALTRSTLYGNFSNLDGGAIYNGGTLVLSKSTISGNSTTDDGGGIENPGSATLSGSTLSGNQALTGYGGGIDNFYGTAALVNSTLSGNQALSGNGGGIFSRDGTVTLSNATLSGNSASAGGGLYQTGTLVTHTLSLKNTIVANSPSGGNCQQELNSAAPISSNGNNLSSDDTCNAFLTQGTDWNTANPNLGPLANNGGPTLTRIPFPLPYPGNRAIDGGNGCPTTDQRGVSRPQGGACDIGAVEYVPGELSPWLYLPLIRR